MKQAPGASPVDCTCNGTIGGFLSSARVFASAVFDMPRRELFFLQYTCARIHVYT